MQRLVGHFLFAAGHLLLDAPLFAESELLRAMLDFPARGAEHAHQAVAHFRTKLGLGRQIVGLVLNHGCGLARIDRDLAAGLVDRVLHVLLPLLFQGVGLADFLRRGGAVGRRNSAVVALKVQIALTADDGRHCRPPWPPHGGRRRPREPRRRSWRRHP